MYSLKNLGRRSGRTSLTVAGVTLAVSLMVVMFSVGNGVRDSARQLLADSGVDIFVQANGTSLGFALGDFDHGREIAAAMMEGNPEVKSAFPLLIYPMYGVNETLRQKVLSLKPGDVQNLTNITKAMKFRSIDMDGIIPELAGDIGGIENIAGPGFTDYGDPFYANGTYAGGKSSPNFTKEIMINKVTADQLKVWIDDPIYISDQLPSSPIAIWSWLANATPFKVVRVVTASWEGVGTAIGYIHLSELQYMVGKTNDTVNQILVDLEDPTKGSEVKDWIEAKFPELDAFTVEDFLGEIESVTAVFRGFGEMILLVTGVVVVLFVATVMMISIRERTGEIAALRAIGFSKSSIFSSVLVEAFLIIIIGFLIGMLLGLVEANWLDGYLIDLSSGEDSGLPNGFHFISITPLLIAQMAVVAIAFGLLCGLIPAVWAARLNIAETLKKE